MCSHWLNCPFLGGISGVLLSRCLTGQLLLLADFIDLGGMVELGCLRDVIVALQHRQKHLKVVLKNLQDAPGFLLGIC